MSASAAKPQGLPSAGIQPRRTCIYTAIYGGYDALLQPVAQAGGCDFVCFTDAAWPDRVGAWRIVRSHARRGLHPRMRAKYFKTMSHRVFPGGRLAWHYAPLGPRPRYDRLIWIDGCLRIKSPDFAAEFGAQVGRSGWSLFVHPDRDCIYDELEAAVGMPKYTGLPLRGQVAHYRTEGFPAHAGLMAGGLIARDPHGRQLARINRAWWAENRRWSCQDQLSLPVVLWRLGLGYDPVRLDLWDNPWFDRLAHASDQ